MIRRAAAVTQLARKLALPGANRNVRAPILAISSLTGQPYPEPALSVAEGWPPGFVDHLSCHRGPEDERDLLVAAKSFFHYVRLDVTPEELTISVIDVRDRSVFETWSPP